MPWLYPAKEILHKASGPEAAAVGRRAGRNEAWCSAGIRLYLGADACNSWEGRILAFVPIGERHAIAEVTFAVQVSPAVTHEDRNNLKNAHDQWKGLLPRLDDPSVLAFSVSGSPEQSPPPPIAPLDFVRYKSDGDVDSRLRILSGEIVVNCLTYTRWPHIWKHARALFAAVSQVLPETTQIKSVYLQYINIFLWNEKMENYESRILLDEQSAYVPASVLDKGCNWHLHQGWFSWPAELPGRRILDRMHIDAIRDPAGRPAVKFENLHRLDFDPNNDARSFKDAFSEKGTDIDTGFEYLHDCAKKALSNYLTEDIQGRINLHAT